MRKYKVLMQNQIPKNPTPPKLGEEAVELLTELCFGKNENADKETDAVLVFGTPHEEKHFLAIEHLSDIINLTSVKNVFITGGKDTGDGKRESEKIFALAKKTLPENIFFYCDKVSKNTLENVVYALRLGLDRFKKIVFIAAWGHCGRCRLTLQKYLENADLKQRGYVWTSSETPGTLNPDFWHKDKRYTELIWGEFLRIETYGKRGDIAYSPQISAVVERIHELTGT